jgi:hypothetical protein
MPNEFMVVGEDKTDDTCLLVRGTDGRYYSYHPRRKRLRRVEVDERWVRYGDPEIEEDDPPPPETKHGT